ncbi:MAG: low molecular weight protein-tyrosine-phosphatase [Rhodospirillaceae bacterium]
MKILFVCTGNICRSPTAEGVFRHMVEDAGLGNAVTVDSAGTHGYHIGDPPDPRSTAAAAQRGFDLSALRARKVTTADFHDFDLILAMDQGHYAHLAALQPNGARAEVKLFLDFHPEPRAKDVPDPYYGGPEGFNTVLDMIEKAGAALLAHAKARLRG